MNDKKKIRVLISNAIKYKYQKKVYSLNLIKKLTKFKIALVKKKNLTFKFNSLTLDNKKITLSILQNLNSKKKLSVKEGKTLLNFVRKFSVYLKLKRKYDYNLKLIDNKETHFYSYIFLGKLIFKVSNFNKIQKLNFLLKSNEKVLDLVNKIKHRDMYELYCENLIKEIFLIKSFLK